MSELTGIHPSRVVLIKLGFAYLALAKGNVWAASKRFNEAQELLEVCRGLNDDIRLGRGGLGREHGTGGAAGA